MKKVLVLGGNGFIGRNLCKALLNKNYEVYSFDCVSPQTKLEGVTYIEGDFFSDESLKKALEGKDVVYHALSTINPGNSNEKYLFGYQNDFVQTIKLCEMLKNTNTRMIFLSSGGTVYGKQSTLPISETSRPEPINHYGNLKLCLENTINVFRYQQKADFYIVRIANPYGPGQDYRKGVGFIDAVIRHAINNTPVEIWGDGSVVRDYIYIDDVCEYLSLMSEYNGEYNVINISSGIGTSQNDIVKIVKKNYPDLKVKYESRRTVDADEIYLDNSRMKSIKSIELISLEDGINKYCDYIKDVEKWEK